MSHYSFGAIALRQDLLAAASRENTRRAPSSSTAGATFNTVAFTPSQVVNTMLKPSTQQAINLSQFAKTLAMVGGGGGGGVPATVSMDASGYKQASGPGSRVVAPGGSGGGSSSASPSGGDFPTPPVGSGASGFAASCQQAGGAAVGPNICQFPDGAQITLDAQGKPVCGNQVGRCAPGGVGVGGGLSPMVIGGVALAALMLLR